MKTLLKNIYLFAIISLMSLSVVGQKAELKATASKNKLGLNQRLRIEFSVNKQGGESFKPPSFRDFKVVAGPSQSVSQYSTIINGKMSISFSLTYTYIVQPKRKGTLTIYPASIVINGQTVKSKPLEIKVLDPVDIPKDPNDPNYIAQQGIHLVATVSKTKPYVGEGIYVEYRLYFSRNVGISNYNLTEIPQYNGFWNQAIENEKNHNGLPVKTGTYNGEQYRYAVLRRALLIPTKSGRLVINPMKMDIDVSVPTGRGDFFGNAITRDISQQYSSAEKIIEAKPLPTKGKPLSFSGAVGDFNFNITADKDDLKANESSQIKVAVTGNGNMKLFELPKIKTPKELETYAPERDEKIQITPSGMRGTISEKYTVVPQYKGKYKIPKVIFSYFNPKEKKYHTVTTEDLFVKVLQGKTISADSQTNLPVKQDLSSVGQHFMYIQTKTDFQSVKNEHFFKSTAFYLLLLLPLLCIPFGIFIDKTKRKRTKDISGNNRRKADRLAKKYLSEARQNIDKKSLFYEILEKALHNYLKAKLEVETSEISQESISKLLMDKGVESSLVNQFAEVLKDCDFARYTPTTDLMIREEYEKAKKVIVSLDKHL